MKLFYQIFGIIIGFVIGILTATTSVSIFAFWVYSDTKKSTGKKFTGYRPGRTNDSKTDRENPLEHKYKTREEAEEVMDLLLDLQKEIGQVTLNDLSTALGITATFEDLKWGWKSLDDVYITTKDDTHYAIVFPAARNL
jgi:hypothetical protein